MKQLDLVHCFTVSLFQEPAEIRTLLVIQEVHRLNEEPSPSGIGLTDWLFQTKILALFPGSRSSDRMLTELMIVVSFWVASIALARQWHIL
jgi:hypothetical protein